MQYYAYGCDCMGAVFVIFSVNMNCAFCDAVRYYWNSATAEVQ